MGAREQETVARLAAEMAQAAEIVAKPGEASPVGSALQALEAQEAAREMRLAIAADTVRVVSHILARAGVPELAIKDLLRTPEEIVEMLEQVERISRR